MNRESIILMIITLMIVSGCVSPPEPSPTHTLEPPSTSEAPNLTPEPEYKAPAFVPIPNQILSLGSELTEIDLLSYVYYLAPESDLVTWTVESIEDLSISMDGSLMRIRRTSTKWLGNQIVRVEACNPGNLCGHTDISFNLIGAVENGIMHTQVDGIIIEVGGVRIMIDALFINPSGTPSKMEEAMRTAAPPYDQVDLILSTHHHFDHFDAGVVVNHLIHNPQARFVSTDVAVQHIARQEDYDLVSDRVIGIHLEKGESTSQSVSGIDLEIMFISHGDDENLPNFGYLFTLGDQTFFHTGDIVMDSEPVETLQAYGLPEKGIDYAFVPYFMLTTKSYFPYAIEGINARYLVPVHVSTGGKNSGTPFDSAEGYFNNIIAFRQDYSWYPFPNGE